MRARLHPGLLCSQGEHRHQMRLLAGVFRPQREPGFIGDPKDSQMGWHASFSSLLGLDQEPSLLLLRSQFGGEDQHLSLGRARSVGGGGARPPPRKHFWSDRHDSALAWRGSQADEGGTASQRQVPTQ